MILAEIQEREKSCTQSQYHFILKSDDMIHFIHTRIYRTYGLRKYTYTLVCMHTNIMCTLHANTA